jgi:hypothetical protein
MTNQYLKIEEIPARRPESEGQKNKELLMIAIQIGIFSTDPNGVKCL